VERLPRQEAADPGLVLRRDHETWSRGRKGQEGRTARRGRNEVEGHIRHLGHEGDWIGIGVGGDEQNRAVKVVQKLDALAQKGASVARSGSCCPDLCLRNGPACAS
jgi:hypothetical protein